MASLPNSTVPPDTVAQWILGGFGAFLLFAMAIRVIYTFQEKNQQRTVTGVAVTAGVAISLGISPFGTIAIQIEQLSQILPPEYPEWVKALVSIETGFGLLYGLGVMLESGGLLALGSFIVAFLGGIFLPYAPGIGFVMLLFGWLMMEASPADRW